ncbi:Abi family protein [Dysgonomonas termitidis]|uniref:Abi family protein n=1 Tax=Dysgonomonas termitidis TaxID=1516126 RepID=A0ABV9L392_9BACT
MTIPYAKHYQDVPDLVSLLRTRGLTINDEPKARNYLTNIGYFRLSAYFYPLLQLPKTAHNYKTGSTFEQVLNLYRFDRKLRLLVFNEIEKIEVAVRSIMVNTACRHFNDTFWITQNRYFYNQNYFNSSIAEIDSELLKSKEDFIEHFKNTYSDVYPPAWMLAEILPLGNICRIYKNLNDAGLKKKIARQFGMQPQAFESWIMTIGGLRNMCCHHSRLWNRVLPLRTSLPQNTQFLWLNNPSTVDVQRVYFRLCMIRYLLFSVSPHNTFREKLVDLLSKYPGVDINAMGFTAGWQQEPLWR